MLSGSLHDKHINNTQLYHNCIAVCAIEGSLHDKHINNTKLYYNRILACAIGGSLHEKHINNTQLYTALQFVLSGDLDMNYDTLLCVVIM